MWCPETPLELEEDVSEISEERILSSINGDIVNIEDFCKKDTITCNTSRSVLSKSNSTSQNSLASLDLGVDNIVKIKCQNCKMLKKKCHFLLHRSLAARLLVLVPTGGTRKEAGWPG